MSVPGMSFPVHWGPVVALENRNFGQKDEILGISTDKMHDTHADQKARKMCCMHTAKQTSFLLSVGFLHAHKKF